MSSCWAIIGTTANWRPGRLSADPEQELNDLVRRMVDNSFDYDILTYDVLEHVVYASEYNSGYYDGCGYSYSCGGSYYGSYSFSVGLFFGWPYYRRPYYDPFFVGVTPYYSPFFYVPTTTVRTTTGHTTRPRITRATGTPTTGTTDLPITTAITTTATPAIITTATTAIGTIRAALEVPSLRIVSGRRMERPPTTAAVNS